MAKNLHNNNNIHVNTTRGSKTKNPLDKLVPVNEANVPNPSMIANAQLEKTPSIILDELDIGTIYNKTGENISFNAMEELLCKRIFTAPVVSLKNNKTSLFCILSDKDFVAKFIGKYQGLSTATEKEKSLLVKSVALQQRMIRFRMKYSVAVVIHKTAPNSSIAVEYKLKGLRRAMETREVIIKPNTELSNGPLVSVESTFRLLVSHFAVFIRCLESKNNPLKIDPNPKGSI